MKAMIGLAVLCTSLLSASAPAQSVWKCEIGGKVTYQQSPCDPPPALVSRPGASSANAQLLGQWKADHALTMAWVRQHMTLTKTQDETLDQRIGYQTLTFTSDRMQVSMPDHDVVIDGATTHVKGIHQDVHYVVVAAGPKMVTVSGADPDTGETTVDEFNFEGHDTAWSPVHIARTWMLGMGNPEFRVYYRRVK